jgi:general secretion pathway protein H
MRLEFNPYGSTFAFTIEMSLGAERYAVAASPVGDVQALPGTGETNGDMALR